MESFPEENISPFGLCLVIPPQSFREEWREQLKSEGCSIFSQAYNGRIVFMVKRKDNQNSEAEPTPIPEPKPKRFEWTPQDVEALKEMKARGVSLDEIAKSLKRTRGSILGKLKTLKKAEPPKPLENDQTETVNCEVDLVGELIAALQLLYPRHKRIAKFILENASKVLDQP